MQPKTDSIQEGELFLMGQGEKDDKNYISGLYRANHNLDFNELQAEFASLGPDIYLSRDRDISTLLGDAQNHYICETNFQLWLMDNDHVSRVPCKTALICARRLNSHSSYLQGVDIECSIKDPIADNDPVFQPFDSDQETYGP